MSFFPFVATVAWLVFVYRALGWFRRQKEIHRNRLIALGYKENNPDRRLRGDQYMRVAAIVYLIVGLIAYLWASDLVPRYAPAMAQIVFPVVAMLLIPIFPAMFAHIFARSYGEWKHPQGDIALKMRDLQFHIPGNRLVPNGEYGTAPVLNPQHEGWTEKLGLTPRPQPIVGQEAK